MNLFTGHRAQWKVTIGSTSKPIHARLGPGTPVCSEPAARLALELPAELFGKERFRAGDAVEFTSTYLTHFGADRVEWKGKFILRN